MHSAAKNLIMITAALGMLLAILPTAEAQNAATLSLTISPVGAAIKPDIEQRQFTIKATYNFANPAQPGVTVAASTVNVKMTFTCPAGAIISGPPSILINVNPSTGAGKTSYEQTATYTLTVTRDVPGLKPQNCQVSAAADALSTAPNAAPATSSPAQNIPFTAGYFPLLQAKIASKVQEAGPQKQIPFNIELTNKGNAQTQVTFSLAVPESGKWQPILPEVLILDSTSDGGSNTDTAIFSIATPFKNGWNNEEKAFQVIMTPSAAADATQTGNVLTANVLARVRGIYVPGFEPALMLGAVLVAGLLVRARRDD